MCILLILLLLLLLSDELQTRYHLPTLVKSFVVHRMHGTDAAYCDRCHVCVSVGVLITLIYCAKMTELIEMPFGGDDS